MKKTYMTPEAEKIQFNYRDQVVAASAGGGASTPNIGDWTNNPGTSGCKLFLAESWGMAFCDLM